MTGGQFNAATDGGGSILGGCLNLTGTGSNPNGGATCDTAPPEYNTIGGGEANKSQGEADSILGGSGLTLTGSETHSP
jgi:hypothetical protein